MKIGGRDFDFSRKVYVMGILNVTPDSFSDGGLYEDVEMALDHALRLEAEGADMIDVGGESTRPGSNSISIEEEKSRVLPILKKIIPKLKIPISIDTRKSEIARMAFDEGASLLNDVSALEDPFMGQVLKHAQKPMILMHKKGEPKTMQQDVHYQDVVAEIFQYLQSRIQYAQNCGLEKSQILVDPGLGFGKGLKDNLLILQKAHMFRELGCPVVIGASRKSFVRKIFGDKPQDVLSGSVVAAVLAAERGASLLRVHDVLETKSALRLANL